jgi:hypothetical protein
LAAKLAKTHRGGTSARTVTLGPVAEDKLNIPKLNIPVAKKGTTITPISTQWATDQRVADERKEAVDKEIQGDPSDDDKKLRISTKLEVK